MINLVCSYIHNWFDADKQGKPYARWADVFTIEDGGIDLPLLDGQYFRIIGSKLNDGIYQYPTDELTDETFSGEIRECVIPRIVLDILDEIETWQTENAKALQSPYQSESFGGYSYSKGSASSGNGAVGNGSNWETVFGYRLTPWRKLYDGR